MGIMDVCMKRNIPGAVCHLDRRALAFNPSTSGHRSIAKARPTQTAADGAITIIVVTRLPRLPRTKTTILSQVPHLQRGLENHI